MKQFIAPSSSHAQSFQKAIIDLFRHTKTNHMSPYLYDDHAAIADGEPISGALMWQYSATREPNYYIARNDIEYLQKIVEEISQIVPESLPFIDLGPGSLEAVENKSLKLLRALNSSTYQPIDVSEKFTKDSEDFVASQEPQIISVGKVADFRAADTHHDFKDEIVMYYGGGTISNLVCPSTNVFPHATLIYEMEKLAKLIKKGWTIISYDGVQDAQKVLAAYKSRYLGRFFRNILYMAHMILPTQDFDPNGFRYEPRWIPSAHLLAHVLVATKSQSFFIGSEQIRITKGEEFDVLNSYKFTPQIFKSCCEQAGFEVVKSWEFSETPMKFCLLKCDTNTAPKTIVQDIRELRLAG